MGALVDTHSACGLRRSASRAPHRPGVPRSRTVTRRSAANNPARRAPTPAAFRTHHKNRAGQARRLLQRRLRRGAQHDGCRSCAPAPSAPRRRGAAAAAAGSAPRRARSRCAPDCAACGSATARLANRLSKNCTAVVTTTGASQFSRRERSLRARRAPRHRPDCAVASPSRSSRGVPARRPRAPSASRNTCAVCSMIEVKGITTMTRSRPVLTRMGEREGERGERLAAAGRHGQREDALRLGSPGDGCAQHIIAQCVELARRSRASSHPVVQRCFERRDRRVVDPRDIVTKCIKSGGGGAVRVNQAGKDHAGEEGQLKAKLAFWPPHAHGPATLPGKSKPSAWAARSTGITRRSWSRGGLRD